MSGAARYTVAFSIPLAATLALTPLIARVARRYQMLSRPRADRFAHSATPYLGGVGVGLSLILVASLTSGFESRLSTMVLAALAIGGLGLLDDIRGVRPTIRLGVEALAAVALWIAGVRVGFFGIEALDLLLTIVWVIAITNACNLLDNFDGVASGVGAVAALGFFVIAAREGHYLVASLALGLAGASLGFLRWNFPPAKIYLGDAGALLLGFLLASIGLELDLAGPSAIERAVIPLLALAVPVFDMLLVIAARALGRRPITVGGTDHTAHRLAARGIGHREVAITAMVVQAVCSILAIALTSASDAIVTVATGGVCVAALCAWTIILRMQPPIARARQPI